MRLDYDGVSLNIAFYFSNTRGVLQADSGTFDSRLPDSDGPSTEFITNPCHQVQQCLKRVNAYFVVSSYCVTAKWKDRRKAREKTR